jgi:hypothetical protein
MNVICFGLFLFPVGSSVRVAHSTMYYQSESSINASKATGHQVEFVVAAFTENLSWIDHMLQRVPNSKLTLYCAGPTSHPNRDPRCIQVKNMGDDLPSYLNHIIDNYDSGLAPITLFAMGSAGKKEWHYLLCRKLNYVASKLDTADKQMHFSGFAAMAHRKPTDFEAFDPQFDIFDYRAHTGGPQVAHCRPSVAPLGKWYKTFVDTDLERAKRIGVMYNDIFAVSAENIRKWPKPTYQSLYDEIYRCNGTRATAGHYIERSLKAMFDTDPPQNKLHKKKPGPNVCPIIDKLEKNNAARVAMNVHIDESRRLTPP